jgi:hypothetical protein
MSAELRHEYAREWAMLHPGQRAFIPRTLFIRCFAKRKTQRPHSIKAIRTYSVRLKIPGVTSRRVPAKVATLRIDYGPRVPSQTSSAKAVSLRGVWYWITPAASTSAFKRLYFCS